MRAVVQRASEASVEVEGRITGRIDGGLVVFLGVRRGDGDDEIRYLGEKVLDLRVFPDDKHAINRSLRQQGGGILLVSQFTLYGDCRKGRRPSFDDAEAPARAEVLYRGFAEYLTAQGFRPEEGVFGASMVVRVRNDGPVTILLDSERRF